MNTISLKGTLTNIQPSHTIKDIIYDKADLIVHREDGKEDIINLRFKRYSNPYEISETEGKEISLVGNVRSYSTQVSEDKNKVQIYVFTYFDKPEYDDVINEFEIDGRICKMNELRETSNGRINLHFILANNLIVQNSNQKLNAYLPCIAWGSTAKALSQLSVNDRIQIKGELHSREYKKILSTGEVEIRVAHELLVTSFIEL